MKRLLLLAALAVPGFVYAQSWDGQGHITRSNGTHSGADVWQQDRDAGLKINAQLHDIHDQNLATSIENCLTKDGQVQPTTNLPMNGKNHLNVGNATARNQYATVGQIQDNSFLWGGTATGSGGAYTVALSPAVTAYTTGLKVTFFANHTWDQEGYPTLNVNGLGTKQIGRVNVAGQVVLRKWDIVSGQLVYVVYNGTRFVLLNPASRDSLSRLTAGAACHTGTASTYQALGVATTLHIGLFDTTTVSLILNKVNATGGDVLHFRLYMDGAWLSPRQFDYEIGTGKPLIPVSFSLEPGITAGTHTFEMYWSADSANPCHNGIEGSLRRSQGEL